MVKVTNFASGSGSAKAISLASGKPSHGMTIDHASTHRKRYTRCSAPPIRVTRSLASIFRGLRIRPEISTVHGSVFQPRLALTLGSPLPVPNS
ncbi:MAG: hypothetical protein RL479_815 [Verrucomicrobiota bacterium]